MSYFKIKKGCFSLNIIFKLEEIRNKKRLTQILLAKISGISQSHISELELNKQSPTLKTWVALSIALKIHPYELIDITEESSIEYYL